MRLLSILLILITMSSFGQEFKKEADEKYTAQNWEEAIKPYKKHLKFNASDSSSWYRLGICQYKVGEFENAIKSFDHALETNFYPGYTLYAKARVLAILNSEESLLILEEATKNGYSDFKSVESDEEWDEFREKSHFKTIFGQIRENAFPCLRNENARHFDFWVGEWDVFVKGNKVGENKITLAEGGCAIHESYTTPRVYSGQSINYFDPKDQKWHQTWVDSNGGVLDYMEIDRVEGMLKFQCDYMNSQGQIVKSRLTFTLNEDGTVRQLFEDSEDGETWSASFDGLYRKKL